MLRKPLIRLGVLFLSLLLLSAGCDGCDGCDGCGDKYACDCPKADMPFMTTEEMEAMLDELVESGFVEAGSKEEGRIRARIRKAKTPSIFFGDAMRDTGYPEGGFWMEPATPSQYCEVSFLWRTCFEVEKCKWPGVTETGVYTESIWIRPAAGFEGDVSSATRIYQEFERESLSEGECDTFKFTHSGLFPAGVYEATIRIRDVPNEDCAGETDRIVTLNDSLVIQFEVGCFCGAQEMYNVAMVTAPYVDFTTDDLRWNLQFPWGQCKDNPPETRLIHEKIEIERVSDGVIVVDREDDFEFLMGGTMGRSYPLDSGALVSGETYNLIVEIGGGDCSCREDVDILSDNRQMLTFSL